MKAGEYQLSAGLPVEAGTTMGLGSNQLLTHGCRLERPSPLPCVAFASSLRTRVSSRSALVEREKTELETKESVVESWTTRGPDISLVRIL